MLSCRLLHADVVEISISISNCTPSYFSFLARDPKDSVAWRGYSPVARVGFLCLLSLAWVALSSLALIAVRVVGKVLVLVLVLLLLEVDLAEVIAAAAAAALVAFGPPIVP